MFSLWWWWRGGDNDDHDYKVVITFPPARCALCSVNIICIQRLTKPPLYCSVQLVWHLWPQWTFPIDITCLIVGQYTAFYQVGLIIGWGFWQSDGSFFSWIFWEEYKPLALVQSSLEVPLNQDLHGDVSRALGRAHPGERVGGVGGGRCNNLPSGLFGQTDRFVHHIWALFPALLFAACVEERHRPEKGGWYTFIRRHNQANV